MYPTCNNYIPMPSVFELSHNHLLYLFDFLSISTELVSIYMPAIRVVLMAVMIFVHQKRVLPGLTLWLFAATWTHPDSLHPPFKPYPAGAFLYFQHHASPNQSPCFQVQGQEEGSHVDSQHHYHQCQWSVVSDAVSQTANRSSLFAVTGSPSPGRQPSTGAPEQDTAASVEAHALGRADSRYDPLAFPISPASICGSSSHRHPYPTTHPNPQPTSVPILANPSSSQLSFHYPSGHHVNTAPHLCATRNCQQDCQGSVCRFLQPVAS